MNVSRYIWIALATTGIAATGALAATNGWSEVQDGNWKQAMPDCMRGMGRMPMMHAMHVSDEFDYLSQMILHHQEAIETARHVLERSDRPEMQTFAQDIITTQGAEIEQMQTWLNEWYPNQQSTVAFEPMMRDLEGLQGDALDQTFLEDMMMHHRGAVMMSQMLLNHNLVEHEAIAPFATQIASTQRAEIAQMQSWLQGWFPNAHTPGMMDDSMHQMPHPGGMGGMHQR